MPVTATIDLSGWNKGAAALVAKTGLEARTVVAKEAAELVKTLVNVSPPSAKSKGSKSKREAEQRIGKEIPGKFSEAGQNATDYLGRNHDGAATGTVGKTGIRWYGVSSKFLLGVAPDLDLRQADQRLINRVAQRLTPKGNLITNFKKRRTAQRVRITQKLLATKKQLTIATKYVQSHVGRLKAGWAVALFNGRLKISGVLPNWITRHKDGAKGNYVDGLAVPEKPTFTIINTARGIGQAQIEGLMRAAVAIRVKAMATNLRLFQSGKKKISDYAK